MENKHIFHSPVATGQYNTSIQYTNSKDNLNSYLPSNLSNTNKCYVPLTGCVVDHILSNSNLCELEKFYYLLADSLSVINKSTTQRRAAALPAEKWALRLNCSRSRVFELQNSLAAKGYFIISRSKNHLGQNKRNLIGTTLPDQLFCILKQKATNQKGQQDFFDSIRECKRSYLDRTKLFLPVNYQLLSLIIASPCLNSLAKIIWLDLFFYAIKNRTKLYQQEQGNVTTFISFKELALRHNRTEKHISKVVKELQSRQFLKALQQYQKKNHSLEDRQDKSLWKITLLLPDSNLQDYVSFPINKKTDNNDDILTPNCANQPSFEKSGADSDPHFAKSGLLLNKDFKAKKIDNIRFSSLPKFWANSVTGRESESIFFDKNEVFANSVQTTTFGATVTSGTKKLTDFYPLSPQDCNLLQSSSRREFTLQAMNEILLDMGNRLTDRCFTGKKAFLSYMSKAFAYEKRDAVKISNVDFKIRANHSTQDQMRIREEFLTKIENSCSVSLEDHFRKKLAAILEPAKAYQLLQALQRIDRAGDKIKLFLSKEVPLTDNERQIILAQAKAVYERLSLASEEIRAVGHLEIIANKFGNRNWRIPANRASNDKGNRVEVTGNDTGNEIDNDEDIVWQAIREKLRVIYGSAVDRNWFSKLVAIRDETAKTITLQAPSLFIRDWISSNYQANIEKMARSENYSLIGVV